MHESKRPVVYVGAAESKWKSGERNVWSISLARLLPALPTSTYNSRFGNRLSTQHNFLIRQITTSSAYLSIYNIYVWTRQHQTGLSYQSSCERSDGRLASPGPVASRTQQVLSSNLIRNKFQAAKRKKTLSLCSPQGLALTGMSQGSGVSLPG